MSSETETHIRPDFGLEGMTALVTGASRGLGFAAASTLAGAGARVILAARGRRDLDEAVARIVRAGGEAEGLAIDLGDPASHDLLETLPRVDVLVNNAGTNRPKPFLDVDRDDYRAVMDLNVEAMYFTTQAVVRKMVAAGAPGSIVNVSSQMGHVGAARRTIYVASKWAVEGLTKALAVELAPHGIRVNAIAPTFVETPMTAPFFEDEAFRASVLEKIKLGRIGVPEDIAGAILLLASRASGLMTGSSILIDGGWTAE